MYEDVFFSCISAGLLFTLSALEFLHQPTAQLADHDALLPVPLESYANQDKRNCNIFSWFSRIKDMSRLFKDNKRNMFFFCCKLNLYILYAGFKYRTHYIVTNLIWNWILF